MKDLNLQLMTVLSRSSEVSGKENLSRALFDASALLMPRSGPVPPGLGKVTSARRLRAMAALQEQRKDLDHSMLIAAVDAAAMWTDADEDDLVIALLRAVGGDDAGMSAYRALTGIDEPRPPEQSEGLPS